VLWCNAVKQRGDTAAKRTYVKGLDASRDTKSEHDDRLQGTTRVERRLGHRRWGGR
jgi:hypothetical protein